MSLKWIFALLVVFYGFNSFAFEIEFSRLIEENYQDQLKMAHEIQEHLGITHQKIHKDSASLESNYIFIK